MDVNLNSITGVPYATTFPNNMATNPLIIIIIAVVIIAYYVLFASLGVARGESVGQAAPTAGK